MKLFRVSQLGMGMLVAAGSAWQAVEVAKRSSLLTLPMRWAVREATQPYWMDRMPESTCRVIGPASPLVPYVSLLLVDLHSRAK